MDAGADTGQDGAAGAHEDEEEHASGGGASQDSGEAAQDAGESAEWSLRLAEAKQPQQRVGGGDDEPVAMPVVMPMPERPREHAVVHTKCTLYF